MLGEPRFWSRELRDGAVLEEAVPAGTVLFLTGVAITPNASAAGRTGLWAKSGDLKALLCTLSASKQVDAPQVRQPFTVDVTFSLTGEKATVQLSGYTRGAPPSAKTLGGKALPREATDGKAAAGKASTRLMAVSGGHKRRPASIAADAKAVPSDQLLGLAEKEAEDDESEGEGESEEESEGEGEGESEGESGGESDGEESEEESEEDDEEQEEGEMALAPQKVMDILKGKGKAPSRDSAKEAKEPAVSRKPSSKRPSLADDADTSAKWQKALANASAAGTRPQVKAANEAKSGGAFKKLKGGLELQDVSAGHGAATQRGNTVRVQYIGTLTNGKRFDAGTISFRLGAGEVIQGWDHGLQGMRVGGKRNLRIPPKLAYGARGAPPTIPGNSTLLFNCQLLSIR